MLLLVVNVMFQRPYPYIKIGVFSILGCGYLTIKSAKDKGTRAANGAAELDNASAR
jgi:hypothetical protein